jgi:hypothetical protein
MMPKAAGQYDGKHNQENDNIMLHDSTRRPHPAPRTAQA